MRSGNEMYCIIFNCLIEVTGIKWQNFAILWEHRASIVHCEHMATQKCSENLSCPIVFEKQKFLTVVGFFWFPPQVKKTTQNTFSLQNSHEPESQRTHLEYISKKCQCQNSLLSRLLPWQAIDDFLEQECLSRSWGNLSYHLPFCKFWVFYYQWIFYQCLAGVKRHWCTDIRSLHCLCLLWTQHLLGGFSKVLCNLQFHLLFIHKKIASLKFQLLDWFKDLTLFDSLLCNCSSDM